MAVTQNSYTGNNSTTNYSFTFPYLKTADVKCSLDGVVTTAFTLANATTVQFNTAPGSGVKIKIYRETADDSLAATFYAGSSIKSEDLNDNFTQNLYTTQEVNARYLSNLGGTMTGNINLGEDVDLTFEGATDNAYETTLTVADPTADRTITLPNVTGTVVTTGDTATVTATMLADNSVNTAELVNSAVTTGKIDTSAITTAKIANDAVTGIKIADDQINSEHYVDGSIDTAHIADNQITTAKIVNDAVTQAKIADDAVGADQLASNSVVSASIVDGSIVTADIADNAITNAKLADDTVGADELIDSSVNTVALATNAVTLAKMADNSVGTSELVDAAVSTAKLVNGAVDTDKINSGAVTTIKINNDAVTYDKLADDSVGSAMLLTSAVTADKIATNAVTTNKIADDAVSGSKISHNTITVTNMAANSVDSTQYVDGSIDTEHIADNAIDSAKIAANAVTTTEIADAELTTLAGMQSGTASILAGGTALTATLAEINTVVDGKSVQTTISDTDASYPTSGAVVDYVAAQIAPLGGLEVIANEDSFPTQPASGVVISIADAGGIVVNGSGVSTTARTSGNGSDNVTINGFPSSLYSTTLAANMGLMVSSTGSSNTYTYHKLLGKEDDIKQLSDDINDFQARYRVASSAPSSSLDNGDLWYDTSNAKMMVYNSTASAWEEVTSTGDFYINTISSYSGTGGNSATFNGSAYRFVLSNPPQAAQQLIVSVNGVLQKPNSGTGQPSEGFALNGSSIVFAAAPATSSPYFIITVGSTVAIGTPSDNTVSTAKIQNLAVTGDKVATNLDLADNKKIRFGTGNDLSIYHDGTNSHINNTTGYIVVGTDSYAVKDQSLNEFYIKALKDGAVELYHNNVKKLETLTDGAKINGSKIEVINTTSAGDSQLYLEAGEGGTAFIQFIADNGDDNTDKSRILQADGANLKIQNYDSGSWATKFETTSDGVTVTGTGYVSGGWRPSTDNAVSLGSGSYRWYDLNISNDINISDNGKVILGDGDDLQIYHDGTHSNIINTTGNLYINASSSDTAIACKPDGAVELYYDNALKFKTRGDGVNIYGHALFGDSNHALFGDGNDLKIYHDGTNSWINNTTGALYLKTAASNAVYVLDNNDDTIFRAVDDGATVLYYDNSSKFETTSVGATLTGRLSNWYDATQVAGLYLRNSNDSGTAVQFVKNDGGIVGSISQTASATSYNTSSDYRLKENEVAISDGITRLKTLKPYKFNFKVDPDTTVDGFFAHEVTPAVPEAITGEKDGTEMQGIDQSKLVPLLTAALQEAITKIETLETKVAALEAK